MSKHRLNLQAIEQSLREVQQTFPQINAVLRSRRDSMTEEVFQNMMAGYAFIDWASVTTSTCSTLRMWLAC